VHYPTAMDGAGKQRVKDALIAQVKAALRSSRAHVSAEDSAAELDPVSSYSVDDQSQADEAGDLGGLTERVARRQEDLLSRIESLDFGPKSVVSPGALVGFDGDSYVVGVAAAAFDCDGISYEGIASDAPIYASLEGLRAGDTFDFDDHEYRVDFVA
jgi:hypothetical protein